jgi:hypothetical protein
MAEEPLVKESLTEEMKKAGADLTRKLDEAKWPVVASFWLFIAEENEWKLFLASPKLVSDGPKNAYEAISDALSTLREHFPTLESISVMPPNHELVRALRSAIQTGWTIGGIRFSKNTINGRFIDDAYLYRVAPETAAA